MADWLEVSRNSPAAWRLLADIERRVHAGLWIAPFCSAIAAGCRRHPAGSPDRRGRAAVIPRFYGELAGTTSEDITSSTSPIPRRSLYRKGPHLAARLGARYLGRFHARGWNMAPNCALALRPSQSRLAAECDADSRGDRRRLVPRCAVLFGVGGVCSTRCASAGHRRRLEGDYSAESLLRDG